MGFAFVTAEHTIRKSLKPKALSWTGSPACPCAPTSLTAGEGGSDPAGTGIPVMGPLK